MKSKGKEIWEILLQYCERGEVASMYPRLYDTPMSGPSVKLNPPAIGEVMCTELRFTQGS